MKSLHLKLKKIRLLTKLKWAKNYSDWHLESLFLQQLIESLVGKTRNLNWLRFNTMKHWFWQISSNGYLKLSLKMLN